MATTLLNRVSYSGADFDTHLDDLLTRYQTLYEDSYNDFTQTAQAIAFVDGFAYGLDGLSFYTDRRATESYLATARTQRAIALLSRQLGYKAGPSTAATVDLNIALTKVYIFNVVIKKGQKFDGPNGLTYEAAREMTFLAGAGPAQVQILPCYEGQTVRETFTGSGQANQTYALSKVPSGRFIAKGTITVSVNNLSYTETDFLTFGPTSQFEVGYQDDPATLYFGDGIFGDMPTLNAPIIVDYVATSGANGRVSANQITKARSPGVLHAAQVIPLTITNPRASVGGDDAESLDDIKKNAGKKFKAREVAVTESDYRVQAGTYVDPLYGRVAISRPFVSRSAAADILLQSKIADILTAVNTPVPIVSTSIAALAAHFAAILVFATTIQTGETDIGALATTADAALLGAITSARAAATSIQDSLSAGTTLTGALTAVTTGGSDVLTAATKSTLLGYVTMANTAGFSAQAIVNSLVATIGGVKDNVNDIGLSVGDLDSKLEAIETARLGIVAEIGTTGPSTASYLELDTITSAVTDQSASVTTSLAEIEAHQDKILADDCKANLVSVPILQFDSSGFYTAPSFGLVSSLQSKLDGIKEVTQVVEVVSGELLLRPAVITMRLGVLATYTESLVVANVSTAIDDLLRGRDFKESLYLSDVYEKVRAITGVSFANITISGYLDIDDVTIITNSLDGDGNLIVGEDEILTKGTVTIVSEVVPVLSS